MDTNLREWVAAAFGTEYATSDFELILTCDL